MGTRRKWQWRSWAIFSLAEGSDMTELQHWNFNTKEQKKKRERNNLSRVWNEKQSGLKQSVICYVAILHSITLVGEKA